jgi:acylglycerol lipase
VNQLSEPNFPALSVADPASAGTIRFFTVSDGYRIAYRQWMADSANRRGCFVLYHGIQSHSGWYTRLGISLAQAGYDAIFPDRRGSGLNELHRGHAPHPDRLLSDVWQPLSELRRNRPEPLGPLFIAGLSWGAKIALASYLKWQLQLESEFGYRGLALLYPGLVPRIKPNPIQLIALNGLGAAGISHRPISIPLSDPALFTSMPQWQNWIARDPLALHQVTSGFLLSGMALDRTIRTQIGGLSGPVCVHLATRDAIIDNASTRNLLATTTRAKISMCEFDDAHTLEFSPLASQHHQALVDWLHRNSVD